MPLGPTFTVNAYYWHFVDVVWLAVFVDGLPRAMSSAPGHGGRSRRRGVLARLRCLLIGIGGTRAPRPPKPTQLDQGEQLYLTGCSSCHGGGGVGTAQAPSLIGVGAPLRPTSS